MVSVWFRTFGCPTNISESEVMKGLLKKAGFEIVSNPEDSFVIVLSICTVKGNATSLRHIRKAVEKYPRKKIVVAGCITRDIVPEIRKITEDASLISTHNIMDIVSVVEETINDNPVDALIPPETPPVKVNLPKIRGNPSVAILPICSGCSGSCRYCSVRIVKGNLFSYPIESIIEDCRRSIARGAREIWITGQDTAAYMLDKECKTQLPGLVKRITQIPGNFKIRVGMMNVNNLMPAIEEMIGAFKHEKVFKFLHLPVQSGSDEILERMGRGYTARQFRKAVEMFRKEMPDITLSTDIICGFPGETKEQFNESKMLIDEIKPDVLNVSRFRPRPGTEAAGMEGQVPGDEAKQRSKAITSIFEWTAYLKNKRWLGWTGDIIIDEKGKKGTGTFIGRNYAYRPIIVAGSLRIGDTARVKIAGYTKHDLRAVLV